MHEVRAQLAWWHAHDHFPCHWFSWRHSYVTMLRIIERVKNLIFFFSKLWLRWWASSDSAASLTRSMPDSLLEYEVALWTRTRKNTSSCWRVCRSAHLVYMKLSLQFLRNAAHKCVKHQKSQAKYLKYVMKDNVNDHTKLSLQFLINAAHKCVTRKKSQVKYLKYLMKDNVNDLFVIGFINRCNMLAISCTLQF